MSDIAKNGQADIMLHIATVGPVSIRIHLKRSNGICL